METIYHWKCCWACCQTCTMCCIHYQVWRKIMSLHTLLTATDLSTRSGITAQRAAMLAQQIKARLEFVHILDKRELESDYRWQGLVSSWCVHASVTLKLAHQSEYKCFGLFRLVWARLWMSQHVNFDKQYGRSSCRHSVFFQESFKKEGAHASIWFGFPNIYACCMGVHDLCKAHPKQTACISEVLQ